MRVNQNGFSAALLLICVLLGILGFVGWRVVNNQSKTESAQNTTSENTQQTVIQDPLPEVTRLSDTWLLKKSDIASIRVPDGFEILENNESDLNFWLPGVPTYEQGVPAKVVGEPQKHFELGIIVSVNAQGWNERGAESRIFDTYSGSKTIVRKFEQLSDPDGLDFAKGTKLLQYKVTEGNNYVSVDYAYQGDGIVKIIDEMVKSIVINP